MLFRKLIYSSIMLSLLCTNNSFAASGETTYYVPIPEDQAYDTFSAINPLGTNTIIQSSISIAVGVEGTQITYDFYEDGYEANIETPVQGSTRVYGDGIIANGDACDFASTACAPGDDTDVLTDNDVMLFENPVDSQNLVPVLFTGRDKIFTSQPVAMTRVFWPDGDPGTHLAGAVEVLPIQRWGKTFAAPIGENIASDGMFSLTVASLMASEDNTVIEIDSEPNGSFEIVLPAINQGQSLLTPLTGTQSAFNIGARVRADKPIQVHLIAGQVENLVDDIYEPTAVYEARSFLVAPLENWDNEYFMPVSTRLANTNDPSDVFVFNPNDAPIAVTCEVRPGSTCAIIDGIPASIPANGFARFRMPDDADNSGARLHSGGTELSPNFYAVATIDSNPDLVIGGWPGLPDTQPEREQQLELFRDSDNQNMDFDGGFALESEDQLSTLILAGYAPSIDPTAINEQEGHPDFGDPYCTQGTPFICPEPTDKDGNLLGKGSPIWVMSAKINGFTTIYVDYDGDDVPGHDVAISVAALERVKVFDENDGDNTGTIIFTKDGTGIAAAWGPDPSSSNRLNPYFDAATAILAFPLFTMNKEVDFAIAKPGDTLTYSVTATNISHSLIADLQMTDELPPMVTYTQDTTQQYYDVLGDGQDIPDNGSDPFFPLTDPGIALGDLEPLDSTTVTFKVTIDDDILKDIDEEDDCPGTQTELINNAFVTSNGITFDDDAVTCVAFPDISIEKSTNGFDADDPVNDPVPQIEPGDTVTWTYLVTNTGDIRLDPVVVNDNVLGIDIDPADCVKDDVSGINALDPGESMTCTVEGVAVDVSNLSPVVLGTCGRVPNSPMYKNTGKATGTSEAGDVIDTDPSHYCNPFDPSIDIEKLTNDHQADLPTDADVPVIPIDGNIVWKYVVTNTGDLPLINVAVVDDQGVVVTCPFNTLDVGANMTCTGEGKAVDLTDTIFDTVRGICDGEPDILYANKGRVDAETAQAVPVFDVDPSHYCNDIPDEGGEGCTPGYWKQSQHFGSWTSPYSPVPEETTFAEVFMNDAFGDDTLLEVLKQGGGGLKALGRHSVAALLNAASGGVEYDLTTDQVINGFNAIYPGGSKHDYNGLKDIYAGFNEQGCPLNRAELETD